ncbi:GNAT family N-acetyltransferase [Lawsonella clevelandensis]|uniref:dTDP-fucosamine acetyltransferase n=1 Tax=Lawsonella clevelandensis TaxID=1528099 RepID=A0A0M5L7R5_9ACTN|nr:GNAT family N-acetyltransferase [Lawsonella clevelandensis]ALE18592.1 hypothetical protein AL705_01410 [Lawsonella clevelandensis]ALE34252.1 hypothetical protein IY73_01440 [Lawsonella clevelandensis]MDU7193636.1 GNAT family N-acetyltransferase [Lawsonella clevelandensis]VHN99880.1 dTDP-fucosamine acetyltransferase [Lawsonella clevelandensis]
MSNPSPDGVIIRAMRESDLVGVGEMTATTYIPYEEPNSPYIDILRDVAPRFREATAHFVAEETATGDILGAVTLAAGGSPWAAIAADDEIEMRMLAVDESARGRGIGTALVHRCQEFAGRQRYRQLVLSSRENMTNAHRLYERAGFTLDPARFWDPIPGLTVRCYVWLVATATR